jgi:DNA helicase-2/ATP-dependent DNA helicase PcrA
MQLNKHQHQAVHHTGTPLLILAGAGAGKTRVLTMRAAKIIKDLNLAPAELLLTTFTNKAAAEMQERLKHLMQADIRLPFAGTFHSLCAKLLRRYGHLIEIPNNFLIYTRSDQLDTMNEVIKSMQLDKKRYNPNKLLSVISNSKNELIDEKTYATFAHGNFQETLAKVYQLYQKKLKQYHALDFDDLLFNTVILLNQTDNIRAKYQNQFKHVLIDEYQDTNKAQYQLTQLLTNGGNLTVVGDASQSIYSWRGADHRNLMNLKTDYPDLTTINLEQNYRSTQTILDAAHAVISANTGHPILKLWTDKDEGDQIILYEASSPQREAEYAATKIEHLKQIHDCDYNSFAIFYRTNSQSRIFEEELLHRGIPYKIVGGTSFYERKEIKDLMSYLRLIVNPADEVSLKRVLKIGKRRYAKFQQFYLNLPLERGSRPQAEGVSSEERSTDLLSSSEEEEQAGGSPAEVVDKTNTLPPTRTLLEGIIKSTQYMKKFDPDDPDDAARIENIQELISVTNEFTNITDFLENASLIESEQLNQVNEDGQGSVTLMTIHGSKGLEFNYVFVAGMEEGIFPHSRCLLDKNEMEEERRLCYVAITRAREKLYLLRAQSRYWFGGYQNNPPSRFLDSIPAELLEVKVDYQGVEKRRKKYRYFDEFSDDLPF